LPLLLLMIQVLSSLLTITSDYTPLGRMEVARRDAVFFRNDFAGNGTPKAGVQPVADGTISKVRGRSEAAGGSAPGSRPGVVSVKLRPAGRFAPAGEPPISAKLYNEPGGTGGRMLSGSSAGQARTQGRAVGEKRLQGGGQAQAGQDAIARFDELSPAAGAQAEGIPRGKKPRPRG
jgi:hypothetical protein